MSSCEKKKEKTTLTLHLNNLNLTVNNNYINSEHTII